MWSTLVRQPRRYSLFRPPSKSLFQCCHHFSQTAALCLPISATTPNEVKEQLEKVRSSPFVNEKAELILQYPQIIDIYDLKLSPHQYIPLFNYLIEKKRVNFEAFRILGIGKLMRLISNTESDTLTGVEVIGNCGILDTLTPHQRNTIFTTQYSEHMRLLTIDILIANGKLKEAHELMELCDENSSALTKFKFKLCKFKEFGHLTPSPTQIINDDFIHIYLREIMKMSHLTVEKSLEYFLLITFKFFELRQSQNLTIPPRVIHPINTTFLALLLRQNGISLKVYLAYFIKLFPQSIPLLEELKFITQSTTNIKSAFLTPLSELPHVNICDELILKESLPYMEDLSLLYEKFLQEKYLSRAQLSSLFKIYLRSVDTLQTAEDLMNLPEPYHPFSRYNHDPSILSKFVNYAFNPSINKLFKPVFASNMILKFYTTCQTSALDIYKSKTHKNHERQLNQLVKYFINVENPNCDLKIALEIINTLSTYNIHLESEVYLKLLDSLSRLSMVSDAKKVYDHICENPSISNEISWKQIIPYAYLYKWRYPLFCLDQVSDIPIEEISLDLPEPPTELFTYEPEILISGALKPECLIAELDRQISLK